MIQEQQELYLLIIRHLNNQTTAEEKNFIATWLNESDENKQLYNELEGIWKATPGWEATATDKALAAVKQRISTNRSWYYRYSAAAALLILIMACGFLFVKKHPVYLSLHSGPGQILRFTLPDGTRVHLAPQSTIRYANRDVKLEGEAYFDVTKNAHQPFTVHAGKLDVKVLGTSFNASQSEISLVSGKVQVDVEGHSFALQPGQQLAYDKNSDSWQQRAYDEEVVTGWTNRLLVFRNETLAQAAHKIERLYDVQIIFVDPEIASYKLFAKFNNKSLQYILDVIKATDNLSYTIKDKKIYITK